MWQATRKAAELIKLVTYCNNVNAYCANLSCACHVSRGDSHGED